MCIRDRYSSPRMPRINTASKLLCPRRDYCFRTKQRSAGVAKTESTGLCVMACCRQCRGTSTHFHQQLLQPVHLLHQQQKLPWVSSVHNLRLSTSYVGKALSFTDELFCPYTVLSSRAEDAHEMYSRGSDVGEATIIDSNISPTLPLIFTGGQKLEIWRNFPHQWTLSHSRSKM